MGTKIEKLPVLGADEIMKALQDLRDSRKYGLKSGLGSIDKQIGGIWRDGIVISGDPGSGKTIFALNLSVGFASSGNRIIYVDLENDKRDIILAVVTICLYRFFKNLSPPVYNLIEMPELLNKKPEWYEVIAIHLRPWFTLITTEDFKTITPDLIESLIGLAKEECGTQGKQAILFLDSINELSLLHPLNSKVYESLERWLAVLKAIRARYQIPISLICHVPKDSTREIFNPKGSSGIAHFARTQMIIKREKKEEHEFFHGLDEIEVILTRAQFGDTGKTRFFFDRDRLGLSEVLKSET